MDQLKVTPSTAIRILADHCSDKGLHHTTSSDKIIIPYEGFKIKFQSSASNKLHTFLIAFPENKIRDETQRGVAAAYFTKVNYQIRNGSFQLDLRDGEVLYFSALPLEGMTLMDCNSLIRDWFDLFRTTFIHHFTAIEEIRNGATIEQAEQAVESATRDNLSRGQARAALQALLGL